MRPNIIYVHSHDTGRYIRPYGHDIPTPHLQRLADDGAIFRQCCTAAPTCSPSRAALLTGMAPHSCGMFGLAHRGWRLNDYGQHIVHTLREEAGYESVLCGFQHVAHERTVPGGSEAIGYDRILPNPGGDSRGRGETAGEFIREDHDRPFFLSVGFQDTHRGFPERDERDDPAFTQVPAPLPDHPDVREDMARFKASARRFDAGVGAVLDALEETGLDEETLVIATTDHGIAFPAMKCNLTDHGTGVMLLMRGPRSLGGLRGGRAIDALTSQIDIFPTICDLVDIPHPDWLQGNSLMPVIQREVAEVNDEIFGEVTYHAAYEPKRTIRTQRWKYIRRFDERERPVMCNCDGSPSKRVWMEHGMAERPVAQEQLYDLMFDPNESNNLAGDPAYDDVRADLAGRLESWMGRTGDPILRGERPVSDTLRTNSPDSTSPGDAKYDAEGNLLTD